MMEYIIEYIAAHPLYSAYLIIGSIVILISVPVLFIGIYRGRQDDLRRKAQYQKYQKDSNI